VVLPNLPDIVVTNLMNGSANICEASGIGVTLYNAGGVASGSFTLSVDVIHNNAIINTVQTTISDIPSLQGFYTVLPYVYVPTGQYTFEIHADVNNVVVETIESNNIGTFTTYLNPCKPNLKFVDCYYQYSKPLEAVSSGNTYTGPVNLIAHFQNNGNLATTIPTEVKFELSGGDVYTAVYTNSIPAGGGASVSITLPSLSPRNFRRR
jgi:hypothetical protein